MSMRRFLPGPARLAGAVAAVGLALLATLSPLAAQAKGLPKPHVSPALDAVLMPITAEVRREFKLGKKAAGVVVVSVDPGGIGELYGLEPGEVLTVLDGKMIRRPVDIDTMVRYGLEKGDARFYFEGTDKNRKKKTIIPITSEDYAAPVAVEQVGRWRGYNAGGARNKGKRGKGGRGEDGYYYSYGGGFFYADFYDAYEYDFYEIYDYTLVYVEEVIITDIYITAYTSDETYLYYDETEIGYDWPDDDYLVEVDEYVMSEEFTEAYYSTEVVYDDQIVDAETGFTEAEAALAEESWADAGAADDGFVDDTAAADSYVEEPVADDGYVEEPVTDDGYVEEPVADDGYVEEPVYEEPAYEEPAYEEPAYEEPVYEEPAYEEPVYEEPVYEEPAYEEPVYEEPAYEEPVYEGGGDCGYDEDGNPLC